MKKCKVILCFIAMVVLFATCSKDDKPGKQEGQIEFGFQLKQTSSLKSAMAEPAAIVVTVTDNNGTVISNNENMPLINFNGTYVTKALTLKPGSYKVTKYMVVDASNNVMYATPQAGSAKAYLVKQPLPISFTISKDKVAKLTPEVLSVANSNPEDFGYSTFRLNIVKTFNFLLAVFTYQDSSKSYELAAANVEISANGSTILSKSISAITETFEVPDGYAYYKLKITKSGYSTYIDSFSNAELKLHFLSTDKGPLKIYLALNNVAIHPCNGLDSITYGGQVYHTVEIGRECWMKENLNIGSMISLNAEPTNNNQIEKYCYGDNPINCTVYGGLYNWDEAMNYDTVELSQGVCPTGWHLPSISEIEEIKELSSDKLDLLFGGYKHININSQAKYYTGINSLSWYWTSSIIPGNSAVTGQFTGQSFADSEPVFWANNLQSPQRNGFSIRCVKNR
jgi:hypothetical protein